MTRYEPEHIVDRIQLDVIAELREIYPDLSYPADNNLADAL